MKSTSNPDRELLARLREDDDLALNTLIARWEGRLFGFAWRYTGHVADSQDLVAETFVRLYQQRRRLRPDTNVSAWLFTTLANLCHNRHRWLRRHPNVSLETADTEERPVADRLPADTASPAGYAEQDESLRALRAALDRLPHDLRTTVLLYYFENKSYREIAEICGCSERGVETRLYRARQRLRRDLEPGQLESLKT